MKIKKKENGEYKLTINQAQLNTLSLVLGRCNQLDILESAENWEINNITNNNDTLKLYELLINYMK